MLTCLYFFCMPLTMVSTPFGSLLKVVTFPVIAGLGLATLFGSRTKYFSFNWIHFTYSIYIIYTLMGLFILRNDYTMMQTSDLCMTFLVLLLITMRVYNQREREFMETVWVLLGFLCAVIGILSQEVVNEFENRTMISIFGYSEDPNQFCAYFILPMMIALERFTQKRRFYPIYLLLMIMILYAVLKTGSRGGLVGILTGIAFYIVIGVKSVRAKVGMFLVAISCAVLLVTVVFPLLPEDVQERYSIARVQEDRGSGRFEIWTYLLDYTTEDASRIIRGSGLYSTYPILADAPLNVSVGVAHNQFIQVLTDQGIIGLMLFLQVVLSCILRMWKTRPAYSSAFLSIMAFSMSLTFYTFKPYINIVMMCAMSFSGEQNLNPMKEQLRKGVEQGNE